MRTTFIFSKTLGIGRDSNTLNISLALERAIGIPHWPTYAGSGGTIFLTDNFTQHCK